MISAISLGLSKRRTFSSAKMQSSAKFFPWRLITGYEGIVQLLSASNQFVLRNRNVCGADDSCEGKKSNEHKSFHKDHLKIKVKKHGMTKEERSRLETLDAALRSESVREHIRSVVIRVRDQLSRRKDALMSWEPFRLTFSQRDYRLRFSPHGILRAGADTGAERHPNSHQRMMSFEGSGDLQTGQPGKWQSNILVSDPDASLERRWISIPANVWHRRVIAPRLTGQLFPFTPCPPKN